jgi:very-short-patch-repair endonuclease
MKNSQRKTRIAKALRERMTDSEQALWRQLRAHRLVGAKFKRQQPIGPYVVDFACLQSRLVIEVDGGQHNESEPDRARDAWLEQNGYQVLRFWNNEVLSNLEGVLERIAACIPLSPGPSPSRGEGGEGRTKSTSLSPRGEGRTKSITSLSPRGKREVR